MLETLRTFSICASLLVAVALPAGGAPPADGTPSDLVRRIYADHEPWAGKEIKWWEPGTLTEYFEPSLVALIEKDVESAATRNEVGCLDGDPFLDAQDYDEAGITKPRIVERSTKDGARVDVSFTGRSEAWKDWNVTLTYDVRMTAKGWRVYDIVFRDGQSLRGVLDCMSNEAPK